MEVEKVARLSRRTAHWMHLHKHRHSATGNVCSHYMLQNYSTAIMHGICVEIIFFILVLIYKLVY